MEYDRHQSPEYDSEWQPASEKHYKTMLDAPISVPIELGLTHLIFPTPNLRDKNDTFARSRGLICEL